jgi:hypothetical protein
VGRMSWIAMYHWDRTVSGTQAACRLLQILRQSTLGSTSTQWSDEKSCTSPYVYATHPTLLYYRTTMVLVTGVEVKMHYIVPVYVQNVVTNTDL